MGEHIINPVNAEKNKGGVPNGLGWPKILKI